MIAVSDAIQLAERCRVKSANGERVAGAGPWRLFFGGGGAFLSFFFFVRVPFFVFWPSG